AWAMADPTDLKNTQQATGTDGKVLVVVQLSGGNDGLNTIVPFGDDAYHRARPGLGKSADEVLAIDNYIGLNRACETIEPLFKDGFATLVQGVGYPNPNRSHFRSMDIWHSAQPENDVPRSGWLGRYFDSQCSGTDPANPNAKPSFDASTGIGIGEELPLAMQGDLVTPMTFENAADYQYGGAEEEKYLDLNDPSGKQGELEFLTRTALDAKASSDKVLDALGRFSGQGDYPGGEYGAGLRSAAAMIAANLPTRVYYVSLGGFDTHANQANNHDRLLRTFSQGVRAFWDDMRATGHADRVLMMTFSEFGRRVAQNGSNGTDHGAAAPMFFFGPNVKPGVVGNHPSLTDLDNGDLKFGVDFRHAYSTVLGQWLETDPRPIIGNYRPLPVLRG
ncbi:MAG: DUF1501 domain-containing protein, partial [Planctomycetota bacterium]